MSCKKQNFRHILTEIHFNWIPNEPLPIHYKKFSSNSIDVLKWKSICHQLKGRRQKKNFSIHNVLLQKKNFSHPFKQSKAKSTVKWAQKGNEKCSYFRLFISGEGKFVRLEMKCKKSNQYRLVANQNSYSILQKFILFRFENGDEEKK